MSTYWKQLVLCAAVFMLAVPGCTKSKKRHPVDDPTDGVKVAADEPTPRAEPRPAPTPQLTAAAEDDEIPDVDDTARDDSLPSADDPAEPEPPEGIDEDID